MASYRCSHEEESRATTDREDTTTTGSAVQVFAHHQSDAGSLRLSCDRHIRRHGGAGCGIAADTECDVVSKEAATAEATKVTHQCVGTPFSSAFDAALQHFALRSGSCTRVQLATMVRSLPGERVFGRLGLSQTCFFQTHRSVHTRRPPREILPRSHCRRVPRQRLQRPYTTRRRVATAKSCRAFSTASSRPRPERLLGSSLLRRHRRPLATPRRA